jgi:bacterioferritin-associated ferredoxin
MTESSCNFENCSHCIGLFVCTCMKLTEAALVDVIVSRAIDDLQELRRETGAGDGCMACRRRLQHYLDEYANPPRYRERMPAVSLEVLAVG